MVNLGSIILDAVLAYTLGKAFGLLGIAWGFVIACTFDALLMFACLRWWLEKNNVSLKYFDQELGTFIFKILTSSIIMGLVGYGGIYAFAPFVNTTTTIGLLIQSGLSVCLALVAFALCSYGLKIEQTQIFAGWLKKFFGFKKA